MIDFNILFIKLVILKGHLGHLNGLQINCTWKKFLKKRRMFMQNELLFVLNITHINFSYSSVSYMFIGFI